MNSHLRIGAVLPLIIASIFVWPCEAAQQTAQNRIVILLDSSGSFKYQQGNAMKRAGAVLDEMSKRKMHRWEENHDQVFLVSLDAMPEVVWKGDLKSLKALDAAYWRGRFEARSDYAACTDVEAGLRLSTSLLGPDASGVYRFLFMFSDLLHEPPAKSIRKCGPAAGPEGLSQDFPWDAFSNIAVCGFWLSPEGKFAWMNAVRAHGLGERFYLFTTTESEGVDIPLPTPAQAVKEPSSWRIDPASAKAAAGKTAVYLLYAGLALVSFVIFIAFVVVAIRRSRATDADVSPAVAPRG